MKQRKLLKQLYQACLEHDTDKIQELKLLEFQKILKHKSEGKSFGSKWTLVRI